MHYHHEGESGSLDRRLWASAALNLAITLVEFVGGLWPEAWRFWPTLHTI